MKIFKLKADTVFKAKDIEDDLSKLSEHFKNLSVSGESDLLIGGEIILVPGSYHDVYSKK